MQSIQSRIITNDPEDDDDDEEEEDNEEDDGVTFRPNPGLPYSSSYKRKMGELIGEFFTVKNLASLYLFYFT